MALCSPRPLAGSDTRALSVDGSSRSTKPELTGAPLSGVRRLDGPANLLQHGLDLSSLVGVSLVELRDRLAAGPSARCEADALGRLEARWLHEIEGDRREPIGDPQLQLQNGASPYAPSPSDLVEPEGLGSAALERRSKHHRELLDREFALHPIGARESAHHPDGAACRRHLR